jgi:hypothetical protein
VRAGEFLNKKAVNETDNHNSITASGTRAETATGKSSKVMARTRAGDKIRSELNIEKWPAIWQPSKSKNRPALRTMQREITGGDGTRIASRVEVGYTQLGTLTTEEQKLLYVLIKIWEESGKPEVQVFFSTRGLARMLRKKGWGTNVIHATTKSLRKLRTIPIEWINSYYDRTKAGEVMVDRRPFTILGDLRIVERRQDGAVNSSLGYFKFDDHILRNLQLNFTKPVCIEEFFKLKSEIAQLIYSHVDLMMFDKSRYERRSQELFDDLGLKNPEYSHMYERKRALLKALKELEGIRLSKGAIKSATVEKTKDGKDYKAVFVKVATARGDALIEESFEEPVARPIVINDYGNRKDPLMLDAEEVVRYFHKTFHGVDSHAPQSKETGQALSLVSQHSLTAAKRIVDFARTAAAKTNYPIQHFGGVLAYASRALAEANHQAASPAVPAAQREMPVADAPRYEIGERRLASLSPDQCERRFEKAKADLFRDQPFLAQAQKQPSSLIDRSVRGRVVRELETEPMDLLPFDSGLTAKYPWLTAPAQNLPL